MSWDAVKHKGCMYRADGERHLFKHSLCLHTRSLEFQKQLSSYVTLRISSPRLTFSVVTGYSGATIRKRGDFNVFRDCLQWQD